MEAIGKGQEKRRVVESWDHKETISEPQASK